jgi:ketosteroid isomerase-like protein
LRRVCSAAAASDKKNGDFICLPLARIAGGLFICYAVTNENHVKGEAIVEEELLIRRYFDAWLHRDGDCLTALFDPEAVYTECHGPEYHGIGQIRQWFADWNQHGEVVKWTIKRFFMQGKQAAAEWYFECVYEGVHSTFDGVSLIVFNQKGAIREIREFESRHTHTYPYGI